MGFSILDKDIINSVTLARSRLDKCLTVISEVTKGSYGTKGYEAKHSGSGCYLKYDNFPFVLTARHVVDRKNIDHFVHGVASGKRPFSFRNDSLMCGRKDADVAIYGCFPEVLEESNIVPLEYRELLAPSFNHNSAFYYCNGFPGASVLDLPFMNSSTFVGNPFVGREATLPEGYDEEIHFAVEYPCKTDPPGMSGSPIWNLRYHCFQEFKHWSPDAVSFAGVIHRWHRESQKIIVTKTEFVRDFIPVGITSMKERYNWES